MEGHSVGLVARRMSWHKFAREMARDVSANQHEFLAGGPAETHVAETLRRVDTPAKPMLA